MTHSRHDAELLQLALSQPAEELPEKGWPEVDCGARCAAYTAGRQSGRRQGQRAQAHRVQRAVDLVEEIEGRGRDGLQRKAQRQRGQRLLPPAERGKRAPALAVRPARASVEGRKGTSAGLWQARGGLKRPQRARLFSRAGTCARQRPPCPWRASMPPCFKQQPVLGGGDLHGCTPACEALWPTCDHTRPMARSQGCPPSNTACCQPGAS